MAAFASTADVEAAWRALTEDEATVATTTLAFASAIVRARFPSIDYRITAGTLDADLVKGVVVEMVLRALRNPEGLRQVSVQRGIDDFSTTTTETRDQALSTGGIYLSDDEADLLSPSSSRKAFSIRPGIPDVTQDVLDAAAANRAGWCR